MGSWPDEIIFLRVIFLCVSWKDGEGHADKEKLQSRRRGEKENGDRVENNPVSVLLPENIHLKTLNTLISESAEFLPLRLKIPLRLSRIMIRFLGGNQLPYNHCLCQ